MSTASLTSIAYHLLRVSTLSCAAECAIWKSQGRPLRHREDVFAVSGNIITHNVLYQLRVNLLFSHSGGLVRLYDCLPLLLVAPVESSM